ncbi:MAG: hypothetical protein IT452_19345 [Planctomycetia bacterium]|nr:hypothetical protein [Planctomycetia bacterium]
MKRLAAALLAAILPLPFVFAGDPEPVADLIDGLRAEDAARREACEEELDRRWEEAKAAMEAALPGEKDAEARARLKRLLEHGGPTVWEETVEAGLKRAGKLGWPCLVVRGDGPLAEGATVEGLNLRAELKAPDTVRALRGYVAVWVSSKDVPGIDARKELERPYAPEGHGGIELYVVHPKRGVCHYLRGWWKAERLAAELERGREFARIEGAEELRRARAAALEELKQRPGADSCENVRRHLHPWNCSATECTLKRLALCYRQGDGILGADVGQTLPDPMAGGLDANLGW